jgi:hypothetical protein
MKGLDMATLVQLAAAVAGSLGTAFGVYKGSVSLYRRTLGVAETSVENSMNSHAA